MTQTTTIRNGGTYCIDTGEGNQLTAGVSGYEILGVAQALADQRGEPVYVYEWGGRTGDDKDPAALEITPKETK